MGSDTVFKALADKNRRKMLDLVHEKPGINVKQLAANFEFSRYATMKHLKILELADLVVSEKKWKEKQLYLNAVPIQTIVDRWLSKYSKLWAANLTKLKRTIED